VLAVHPSFSVEQVRQVLRASADDVDLAGVDTNSGYGRLNAGAAVAVDSALEVLIESPGYSDVVSGNTIDITGTADGADFQSYTVEYGTGSARSEGGSEMRSHGLKPL
jgi:hypothetical protein